MSSLKNNISDKTGLFNPKVKAEILAKIESLLAKGDRERLTAWFFEEQSLIREDIQFPGFLELDQFLDSVIIQGLEEVRVLRQEIHHIWKELGATFRVFWHHSMSHAQREGLVINALMHTAATPHGDELRRYVLDFDCAGLCADSGKALVAFIKGVIDPERREHNTPALSDKLHRIFKGWQQANNTADYVAAYKAEYLSQLKHRCLFARDIFACRFVFRLLEMWQSFVATHDPQTVAYANPLGIKNNYDGTFNVVNAAGIHAPSTAGDVDGSKKPPKKASKKKSKGHRGQKSKSDYQLRKRENRERRARSIKKSESSVVPIFYIGGVEEAIASVAPHSPCQAAEAPGGSEVNGNDSSLQPARPISETIELEVAKAPEANPDPESPRVSKLADVADLNNPDVLEEDRSLINFARSSRPILSATDVLGVPSPELSSPYPEGERPPTVQGHIRTVGLQVETGEEKPQEPASDVPELLSDRTTRVHDAVPQDVQPESPSTPVTEQSPPVQILSGDPKLEDPFSLVDSGSDSDSAKSDVGNSTFNNELSVTETDSSLSCAENHPSDDQMLPTVDPGHNLADHEILKTKQQFVISLECGTPRDPPPLVEDDTASAATGKKGRAVLIAIPDQLFHKKLVHMDNVEDDAIVFQNSSLVPDSSDKNSCYQDQRPQVEASSILPHSYVISTINSKDSHYPDQGNQFGISSILSDSSTPTIPNDSDKISDDQGKGDQQVEASPILHQETAQNTVEHSGAPGEETTLIREGADPEVSLDDHTVEDDPARSDPELSYPGGPQAGIVAKDDIAKGPTSGCSDVSKLVNGTSTRVSKILEDGFIERWECSECDVKEAPADNSHSPEPLVEHASSLTSPTSEQSGPMVSEAGLFVGDPNFVDEGFGEKGTNFVGRIAQLLEDSCSQISSRRNSSNQEFMLQVQVEQSLTSPRRISGLSARRNSQESTGSLEDQLRCMLVNSQRSQHQAPDHIDDGGRQNIPVGPPPRPPTFFNGSDNLPCHQAVFHHRPSVGGSCGYYGNSKVPQELKAVVTRASIGSLIFQCNTCNNTLTDEDSTICPMCGINSHTRFCNEECRYAGGFHWKCCGINGLQYATDHRPLQYSGPLRSTGSMNAYRFWHPTLLYDYPGFDFIIFDEGLVNNESPLILRAIIFNEQSLRDRFHAVYKRALWDFDELCVGVLWRVVRAWLRACLWTDVTVEHLRRQFELEFGHGWLNAKSGELPEYFLTEEEWLGIEEYLDRKLEGEGYANTKAVLTKLPLIWNEPRIPRHIAERVAPGGATPTGLHVWY